MFLLFFATVVIFFGEDKKSYIFAKFPSLDRNGILKSPVVEAAMKGVDRANYSQLNPYMDSPQGIGFGQTIREGVKRNTIIIIVNVRREERESDVLR